MSPVGIWNVGADGPTKLPGAAIDLEKRLEEWIERDPGLLESGLDVVGRQIFVEAGPIDLLALDPQGRWVVVEIKRGAVRRDAVAQALDYASCIATMPYDQLAEKVNAYLAGRLGNPGQTLETILAQRGSESDAQTTPRSVVIYVVGTGRDPGLDRMVSYLSSTYDLPISIVTFEVFGTAPDQQVLVRELKDSEVQTPRGPASSGVTVEGVCALADQHGIGVPFRALLAAAQRWGLYPRPFKTSIMYTPPSNRTRYLITVWAIPPQPDTVRLWLGTDKFPEFYPVTEQAAEEALGPARMLVLSPADQNALIATLDRFFETINFGENRPDDREELHAGRDAGVV
jgi:hypothetical protein